MAVRFPKTTLQAAVEKVGGCKEFCSEAQLIGSPGVFWSTEMGSGAVGGVIVQQGKTDLAALAGAQDPRRAAWGNREQFGRLYEIVGIVRRAEPDQRVGRCNAQYGGDDVVLGLVGVRNDDSAGAAGAITPVHSP